MRNLGETLISSASSSTSNAVDANQLVSASVQSSFSDTSAAGSVKLQASNDPAVGNRGNFVPTNWTDIPNTSSTITSGGSALVTIANMAYGYIRAVWTNTVLGAQTITTVPDTTGSLAGKYFKLESQTGHKYVMWFKVSGTGTAPVVPGYTAEEVDIATDDTAATVGAALASAIAALNSTNDFTTSGTSVVTVTNKTSGPFTPAVDVNTGFSFAVTASSAAIATVNLNALGI